MCHLTLQPDIFYHSSGPMVTGPASTYVVPNEFLSVSYRTPFQRDGSTLA